MKKIIIFVLSIIILSALPTVSYAQGVELNLEVESKEIIVGDYFEVTISFTSKESISSLDVAITYDNSLISYVSGGGNAALLGDGVGGITDIGSEDVKTLSYTFLFVAEKPGNAKINITSSEVIGVNGKLLGTPSVNLTISIANFDDKGETPPFPPSPPDTGNEGIVLEMESTLSVGVLPFLNNVTGFTHGTLDMDGIKIPVVKKVDRSGNIYLINAITEDGFNRYYFFDSSDGSLQRAMTVDNKIISEKKSVNVLLIVISVFSLFLLVFLIYVVNKLFTSKNIM